MVVFMSNYPRQATVKRKRDASDAEIVTLEVANNTANFSRLTLVDPDNSVANFGGPAKHKPRMMTFFSAQDKQREIEEQHRQLKHLVETQERQRQEELLLEEQNRLFALKMQQEEAQRELEVQRERERQRQEEL
eukprot:GEZU01009828.1.p1 GENE.GEZU01009828.1~~GEZU01009828.1.p1  ORF type:complete len:134 (+),score=34.51 GEZU01009828.1:300-701(+)